MIYMNTHTLYTHTHTRTYLDTVKYVVLYNTALILLPAVFTLLKLVYILNLDYIYLCIHTHMHTHTHTHTHTYIYMYFNGE